jgi:hypothetical protein
MNEELVKNVIKLKLDILDGFIERLPEEAKGTVRNIETCILRALHEATERYSVNGKREDGKTIKSISIE